MTRVVVVLALAILSLTLQEPSEALPAGAAFRLGSRRFQHADQIKGVAYTPDGKRLFTTSWFSIRAWDPASGACLKRIVGGQGNLEAMAVAPDGKTVYSTGCNILHTIAWDVETGKEKFRLQGFGDGPDFTGGSDPTLAISADGKRLATAIRDDAFRVWDLETRREIIKRVTIDGDKLSYVGRIAISGDGRLLTMMGSRGLYVVEVDTGKVVHRIPGSALFPAFSPDGRRLACGGDRRIGYQVWDIAAGKKLYDIKAGYPSGIRWAPDGSAIAWWDSGKVHVGDPATGELRRTLDAPLHAIFEFSPDGKTLAAVSGTTLRVFDPASGKEITSAGAPQTLLGWNYAPDGRLLVSSTHAGFTFWDPRAGREVHRMDMPRAVTTFGLSNDGRTILTLEAEYQKAASVRRWDVLSGCETGRFDHDVKLFSHGAMLMGRALIPNSGQGAPVDALTGVPLSTTQGSFVAMSRDGGRLFIHRQKLMCIDLASDKVVWSQPSPPTGIKSGTPALISNNGMELFLSVVDKVQVMDTATGKVLRDIPIEGGSVWLSDLSPDGSKLFTTNWDASRIEQWDTRGSSAPRTFTFDEKPSRALFSPDGSTWAAGLQDGTILIWKLKDETPQATGDSWDRLGSEALIDIWAASDEVARRKDAQSFLTEKLRDRLSGPREAQEAHRKSVRELADEDIGVREKAMTDLKAAGAAAEPALLAGLDAKPAADLEILLRRLLDDGAVRAPAPGDESRRIAAIRILERLDARETLEKLKARAPTWAERRTAEAALDRMTKKN